ncbi:glycine zipper 2TM domain-containing protein [Sphingosinicella sp. YJ22]|uniref:glycine zipper 2TM domain-containing protein n=1 Tax=Sphingosinicella sp. YJ22 TaxID=1104780 RepID=UPI001FB03CD7|nr:glycine zipper 2TM domain-containing protein [Sphingosinicella sp. YJ22]
MRNKIALGIVAAAVAIPSFSAPAAAQYYGGYGQSYSPYDLNRDGRVTRREMRRVQEMQRQQARYGNSYYGNSYGYNQGGYYPQSYNSGQYSRYYNQQGYYSGPTWRGNDGRYYCRRSDGTTGILIGGAAGALIGSQVAGRGDRTIGAILGGAVGALIGREVERGNDRNRCN